MRKITPDKIERLKDKLNALSWDEVLHCKNWGVNLTPVGVVRGPHPQVLKLHPRV